MFSKTSNSWIALSIALETFAHCLSSCFACVSPLYTASESNDKEWSRNCSRTLLNEFLISSMPLTLLRFYNRLPELEYAK